MDENELTDNLVADVTLAKGETVSSLADAQLGESLDHGGPADSGASMALREFAGRSQAALEQFVKVIDAVINSNLDLRSKVDKIGDGLTSVSQAFRGASQRLLSVEEQTKSIAQLVGQTANNGNLASNADLLIKQLLVSVQGIAADVVANLHAGHRRSAVISKLRLDGDTRHSRRRGAEGAIGIAVTAQIVAVHIGGGGAVGSVVVSQGATGRHHGGE